MSAITKLDMRTLQFFDRCTVTDPENCIIIFSVIKLLNPRHNNSIIFDEITYWTPDSCIERVWIFHSHSFVPR